MPKNARKHKACPPGRVVPTKGAGHAMSDVSLPQNTGQEVQAPRHLGLMTLAGGIHTELYERLIRPTMVGYGNGQDEEPLRQLMESIVTAIAMRDAYEGFRKIDDIGQRYLYYAENGRGLGRNTRDAIEQGALCDYWRCQAMMMLIRDSASIFELLLADARIHVPATLCQAQGDFLHAMDVALCGRMDAMPISGRGHAIARDLYDFTHGMSFPWLGFDPRVVFGLGHAVPDAKICTHYEFALASAGEVVRFWEDARDALEEVLFVDLLYTQHRKVFDEASAVFSGDERMPLGFRRQLSQRIRFDRVYQAAYTDILNGKPLTGPLHRCSRLDYEALNRFGSFVSLLGEAAGHDLGVYIFHYLG